MKAYSLRLFMPLIAVCVGLTTAAPAFGQHGNHRPAAHSETAHSAAADSAGDSAAASVVHSAADAAADSAAADSAGYSAAADSAAADFVRMARAGTERFRQLEAAIAAGYRLVGPDFPGMGEHWIHVQRIMANRVDPSRPAVLSYLRVDGEAVLTGAAFAVPLRPGEAPPVLPFPITWHEHGGTIADETLHLNPHAMQEVLDEPQLAMFHAWVWTENPAGMFSQQNWALPFHRLGLVPPEYVTAAAGKAAHLAAGGVDYYASVVAQAAPLSAAEMAIVREVLEQTRDDVEAITEVWSAEDGDGPSGVEQLSLLWERMWDELFARLSPDVGDRLIPLSH